MWMKLGLAAIVAMIVVAAAIFFLTREQASVPVSEGYGPDPALPPPDETLLPTVNIAPAVGWPADGAPLAAKSLTVARYSDRLDHPRWLHVLPNGDVLVAETNRPPKRIEWSLRTWIMGLVQDRAGAVTESANRITLLRDADRDGTAEFRSVFLENLNSPFGMALIGDTLYVANTDAVVAFPYSEGTTKITSPGEKIAELPAGPRNHHWTKDLIASRDGSKLYATVGSNSNVAENGMAEEENRAAVLEIDLASRQTRLFASGLRNPNGLAWQPDTGELWVAVNERDEIGSDLVPDYMTSVKDGGFYGWPYSYFGQHIDERVQPPRPDLVAKAIVPDYGLGAHTGSLGLTFYEGSLFPPTYRGGAFVGQHGSWNRTPLSGYKVIFVPFADGKPSGAPQDILTGFVNEDGDAMGRPVGVAVDGTDALLVADDVGNIVWRVQPVNPVAARSENAAEGNKVVD
jgi:glucose/arabinose dehydrogenase